MSRQPLVQRSASRPLRLVEDESQLFQIEFFQQERLLQTSPNHWSISVRLITDFPICKGLTVTDSRTRKPITSPDIKGLPQPQTLTYSGPCLTAMMYGFGGSTQRYIGRNIPNLQSISGWTCQDVFKKKTQCHSDKFHACGRAQAQLIPIEVGKKGDK